MEASFAIFDMDGTLIDSMPYWDRLTAEYLESLHLQPEEHLDLKDAVETMSMVESAEYFQQALDLDKTPEEIVLEMGDLMDRHYQEDIQLRPGVKAFLEGLREEGVVMCVLTLTPAPLAHACLKRLGVDDYFAFVLSTDDVGVGKERPEIFAHTAWEFGVYPMETVVFEDSHYAARAAKQAGCTVVGIYEPTHAEQWPNMKRICDVTIHNWEEAMELLY